MNDQRITPARSFGSVVDAYDRGRPMYPVEAAAGLAGSEPLSVLELGAGTGKLTRQLVALGHDVHATDPDRAMLDVLERDLPGVRTSVSGAEEIPAGDRSFDVVVAAQAFHWFDHDRALPEIARVLKTGGRLSLVWNDRDGRIPWVRRLGALIGTQEDLRDPIPTLDPCPWFGSVEEETFRFWQVVDRNSIQDLVRSRSNIAVLAPDAQEAKMREVLAFYDDFGRGMDGMQLPYLASCYRSVLVDRPGAIAVGVEGRDILSEATPTGVPAAHRPSSPPPKAPPTASSDGADTAMLLIDFN